MNIREKKQNSEYENLSPFATRSAESKGRMLPEEDCEIRTCFERDRDRLLHSKAFRRLMYKTQVFIAPEKDHYRTRLTHTLEVSQIARSISAALNLNETLTEAIALGHDLGHTPFGHTGEAVLNELYPPFEHNLQSLRVVDKLESGKGLNLTWEVRDGIKNHCSGYTPSTLEGKVVYMSDKIAYINHDIDDAMRAGIITQADLPADCIKVLGETHSRRINTMITDVVENSLNKNNILKSPAVEEATNRLREFMFDKVYLYSAAKKEEGKAKEIIRLLYGYYYENPDKLPEEYLARAKADGIQRSICDYIAGMTDRYAVEKFIELFVPAFWS